MKASAGPTPRRRRERLRLQRKQQKSGGRPSPYVYEVVPTLLVPQSVRGEPELSALVRSEALIGKGRAGSPPSVQANAGWARSTATNNRFELGGFAALPPGSGQPILGAVADGHGAPGPHAPRTARPDLPEETWV